ncbi:hypothetical protein [Candidatus Uabimicrobium amorphum]|uniref:Uncharacterized protein n=1 Tax=Uabimicrobium amorphum TaxID=2596890 RepID=A0A5S9IT24_UABAM|nr:hypothetical protein [Candidatus Uabimicrobium amorphum]BBM87414.1 hypothetical protein UABAM_05823 [Candidatus Uabimicrobium amorphum]
MENTKIQAQCANCHLKFYIPTELINQKRPCPKCKKVLLLSTKPQPKTPMSLLIYSGVFFVLTILFMLVWLSMIMQILRTNATGIIPVIAMGTVVLGTLLFTSLGLLQVKAVARYGIYLFMIINSSGAVWQYQRLLFFQAMNMIENTQLNYEITVLVCIQGAFVVCIYVPLLFLLRKHTLQC